MSTYYGGEQLATFTRVSSPGGSGTLYTVPAGRYAAIQINHYPTVSGGIHRVTLGSAQLDIANGAKIAGGVLHDPSTGSTVNIGLHYLDAGETVTTLNNSAIVIEVKEYLKP